MATQRRFTVELAPNTTNYVDTAAILSRINQRLYRQGRGYHISSAELGGSGTGQRLATIGTLPHNWFVANAHKTAMQSWMESTKEERAAGVKAGRWNDFKVYYDQAHATGTSITAPFGLSALTQGEWVYTSAAKADGSGDIGFMMYDNTTANHFGVLAEYDDMRDTDQNTPATGSNQMPYEELRSELVNDQADNLQEEGDFPPYQSNTGLQNLVDPQWQLYNGLALDPTLGLDDKHTVRGIYAPCGLLKISTLQAPTSGDPVPLYLTLEVKAGDYKGVAATEL